MRRCFAILLLLCIPLQSIAMHCERVLAADITMLAHAVELGGEAAHHHEADGSVHFSGDAEPAAGHVLDHDCSPQPASLAPPVAAPLRHELVSQAPPEVIPFVPDPALDSPLRPPRPTLG